MAEENILRTLTLNGKTFVVPNSGDDSSDEGGGGGGSGADKVHVCVPTYDDEEESFTFTETWNEIKSYLDNGYIVAVRLSTPTQTMIQYGALVRYDAGTGIYSFTTIRYNGLTVDTTTYTTDSADGHPILFD